MLKKLSDAVALIVCSTTSTSVRQVVHFDQLKPCAVKSSSSIKKTEPNQGLQPIHKSILLVITPNEVLLLQLLCKPIPSLPPTLEQDKSGQVETELESIVEEEEMTQAPIVTNTGEQTSTPTDDPEGTQGDDPTQEAVPESEEQSPNICGQ